jgi:hypothetical protein
MTTATPDIITPTVPDSLDYRQVLPDLTALIQTSQDEQTLTETRRKRRRVELRPEWMKEQGTIARDFALVPIRLIDSTMTREQAAYVAFLKGERRIAVFKTDDLLEGQPPDTQVLESRFTSGMTYPGWELPFVQCQDGGALHGWDAVEVVLDVSRALHVDIEHIGHDKLIFSRDALDIQNCPNVLRSYEFTQVQLNRAVAESGFDAEQVKLLSDRFQTKDNKEKTIMVYKRFFRVNGVVHVAWFSKEGCCSDWLKKPQPLFLGIKHKETQMQTQMQEQVIPQMGPTGQMLNVITNVPVQVPVEVWVDTPLQNYPIFIYRYRVTEDHTIMRQAGRGDLDKDKQEAQTATVSAFITGCIRACNTYASPETDVKGGMNINKLESTMLEDGGIYDKPLKFFNRPFPDPGMLRAIQYMSVQHQQETSQVDFAVQNREDSRKTATEIQAATQQSSQLSSVQVTMFSIFLREVYTFIWQIVQSRALQGLFVLVPTYAPNLQTGEVLTVNDDRIVGLNYDIRAAGDFDIVQRAEKLQRMGQFLPLVQGTAAVQVILSDMLALAFPEDADRYRRALAQQPMVMKLLQMIGQQVTQMMAGEQNPAKQKMATDLLQFIQQQMQGAQQAGQQGQQPQP